jgi:uncharacterized protein YbaR (Trm112 family)/ribosomal protein S27AE
MTGTQKDAHPNYRLRVAIVVLVMSIVVAGAILATPAWILTSWQYWTSAAVLVVSIWIIYELQPLPKPGRKPRVHSRRGFGPKGSAILLLFITSLLAIDRIDAPFSTIVTYSLFPGILIGVVSIAVLDFLIRGKNRFCENCGEYEWFRPKHHTLYCGNCGLEFQTRIASQIESTLPQLEPAAGQRIVRERREIPPMAAKAPKCKKCKSPMQLTTLKAFSGKAGGIQVSFFDMPCFTCPKDQTKRYAGTEFGMYLLQEITDGLPRLGVTGTFRQSLVCPKCNSGFEIVDRKDTFGLQIRLDALSQFLVDAYLPTTTCPTCKNRFALMDQQMVSNIADAMGNAFKSIKLDR